VITFLAILDNPKWESDMDTFLRSDDQKGTINNLTVAYLVEFTKLVEQTIELFNEVIPNEFWQTLNAKIYLTKQRH
jgi:hypothetical protein